MTYADGREIVPAPQMDYLGHPGTGQEKGRGTLQTSALPLGYGAETDKLAIYLEFLNPPRESPKPLLNLCLHCWLWRRASFQPDAALGVSQPLGVRQLTFPKPSGGKFGGTCGSRPSSGQNGRGRPVQAPAPSAFLLSAALRQPREPASRPRITSAIVVGRYSATTKGVLEFADAGPRYLRADRDDARCLRERVAPYSAWH
jgi:hypothetical protein